MRKTNRALGIGLLVALPVLYSHTRAQEDGLRDVENVAPFIAVCPTERVWNPDGVTENTISVVVNNNNLGGEATRGVDWSISFDGVDQPQTSWYSGVRTPPGAVPNDFFEGLQTLDDFVNGPWTQSSRIAMAGPYPSNRIGNVATYGLIVPQGTAPGQYRLGLNSYDTGLVNPIGEEQNRTLVTECIIVSSEKFQDCMGGPGVSVSSYPDCVPYDFDADGDVDLVDSGMLQRLHSGECF